MTEIFILDYHDHVTKIIVTIFILNSRRPIVQMRPNLYLKFCFANKWYRIKIGFDIDNITFHVLKIKI